MLYAVIPLKQPSPALQENIKGLDSPVYEQAAPAVYVVSFPGTAQELSAALGFGEDDIGTGLIVAISAYYGYADPGLWQWLRAHRYD